jgi:hypothetical protein
LNQRDSKYLKRKKRKYLLPLSVAQRETTIDLTDRVDPISPIDIPREILVGHKWPVWA